MNGTKLFLMMFAFTALYGGFVSAEEKQKNTASEVKKDNVQITEKKDDKKEKPKKVSQLLEKANELMSLAQESYVGGETKKAIEQYRDALKEIERVEDENPERADSSEFAPVRFRKALCETEIDRIMLEEVTASSRTVAVTDTTELEKKRAERKKAAETNRLEKATVKLSAKKSAAEIAFDKQKKEEKEAESSVKDFPVDIQGELEFAKDMQSVDRFSDAEHALVKVLKVQPENREARFLMALVQIQSGRAEDATVVLDDLLADNAKDDAALLLAAAAQTAAGHYSKALDHLDMAMKVNPLRPEGYHNMAWLLLEMKSGESKEAEAYYRQAVKLGGSRDRELERRLGIKTE